MKNTFELIAATAARVPEQIALRFLPQADSMASPATWRYRQLHEQITRFANWLYTAGVGVNDAVSIVLPNPPEYHFAFWGAEAAGIANPINPALEAAHIAAILQKVQAKVLVTVAPDAQGSLWQKMEAVARQVPSLKYVLTVGTAPAGARPRQLDGADRAVPIQDFDEACRSQPGARLLSGRRFSSSDTASYFHTGGTTGVPKVARHTHGNEVAMAQSLARAMELDGGKFLCGLPLFHVNGLTITGLLPFLVGGSVLILTADGYRGAGVFANFWNLIERYGINYFSGVPTIYSRLLEVPIGDADLSSLRYGICGAAPLSPETMRRFEAATGVRLLEGYGLTEAACASTLNPIRGQRFVGSIGKALPGIEVKAVELDGRGSYLRDCADDVVGHLVIRGNTVFPGYLDEAANAATFLPDGWLKTGDLGRRDAAGYFWLAGRAKELIIRGGHNIDPAIIEEALLSHPAVAVAAAVGRPDAHAGEVPVAYVECRAGQQVTAEALMQHATARISERAAIPKAIHILEQMPLTAVGKILKPALVRLEIRQVLAEAVAAVPGVAQAAVEVIPDSRHGVLARIKLRPASGQMRESLSESLVQVLGAFTTRYEIIYDTATAG